MNFAVPIEVEFDLMVSGNPATVATATPLTVTAAVVHIGMKGAKGDPGIQGLKGGKGDKGDKGDTGDLTSEAQAVLDQAETARDGAAASAAQADTARTSAAANQTAAALSATQAAAARDAAYVNANVYVDVATGLAAVADGVQFQVVSADGLSIQRYRRDAGPVAVAVAPPIPTIKKLESFEVDVTEMFLVQAVLRKMLRLTPEEGVRVGDTQGNFIAEFSTDGWLSEIGVDVVGAQSFKDDVPAFIESSLTTRTAARVYARESGGKQQIFSVNGSGETLLSDGASNDIAPELIGNSVRFVSDRDGSVNRAFRMLPDGKSQVSERGSQKLYLVIAHGQSLTRGGSTPITTAANIGSSLMFNAGALVCPGSPTNSTAVSVPNIDSLVPLAAVSVETYLERMAYKLFSDGGMRCIVASTGVGGQAYFYLKKGTVPYTNMLVVVNRAQLIAQTLGFELEVVFTWQHGEADYSVTREAYTASLNELVGHINADIPAITGQSVVHLFAAQSPSLSQSQVPLALFDVANANPLVHLVGPLYGIPLADSQHPTNVGYYKVGELYWRAIKRVVVDGLTWSPYQPVSAVLSGSTITVTMQGQTGSPQIDTVGVSAVANSGFEYSDSSSPPAITSVVATLTGYTITLAAAPTGSDRVLRTAWTAPGASPGVKGSTPGARTNLCDQDALVSGYDGAALPKRCVVAEIPVT